MFITRRELQQQAGTDGGAGGGAGAGAGAGAGVGTGAGGAAGGDKNGQGNGQQGAGAQQQGASGQQQQAGTTTDKGKGGGDTSHVTPSSFVPKLPGDKKIDGDPVLQDYFREFNAIFADEKLSPTDRMQKLVDLQISQAQKVSQAQTQKQADALAGQPAKDLETVRADKDFGGPNFQATVDGAKRVEAFAFGEELGALLKPLGMQSHPVILKGLARLSRVISEDSIGTKIGEQRDQGNDKDAEGRAMFPKSWDKMQKDARKR